MEDPILETDLFNINNFTPLVDMPVVIETNWAKYIAKLRASEFGGFEFKVLDKNHVVQLTTVTGWRPPTNIGNRLVVKDLRGK